MQENRVGRALKSKETDGLQDLLVDIVAKKDWSLLRMEYCCSLHEFQGIGITKNESLPPRQLDGLIREAFNMAS